MAEQSFAARRRSRLGAYELIEEIGRGGMGIVYRARQMGLERDVAVKVLRLGPFANDREIARFRREAAAAAALRHPNIVAVHEVAEADGHAFFSMDLVRGQTLLELTHAGPLEPRRAARYVKLVAEAVAAAHVKGILHRDIKPANVIINADDQPQVTDFGLATRLDLADATVTQQVIGSPGYMAPEQADPQRGKLTVATDVYALGALLYHLLTSRPPFASATIPATLTQVLHIEPVPPRLLNPAIAPDLETLCLKCLHKEPERRYSSARELAEELQRFLDGEPIRARPITRPEKLWRWSRRKPLLASLILLLHVVGAMGLAGILWQWRRAERSMEAEHRERAAAQAANRDLRQANQRLAETVGLLELERAEEFFRSGDAARGLAHLAAMLRRDSSNEIAANRLMSALVHRDWALPAALPMRHSTSVVTACFSPDGRRVLSASWDQTARIWDARSDRPLATLPHSGELVLACFSPDGRRIGTASADKTARVWDAVTGAPVTPPLAHNGKVCSAEFSPDSRSLLTASADRSARIWDVANGALKRAFRDDASELVVARFSPDGELVATGADRGGIRVWNTESGAARFSISAHDKRLTALAFSPDGRRLVSASEDRRVRLWDSRTGAELGNPIVHRQIVWHAAFSPDGRWIQTTCEDGAARLWDVETLRPFGDPLRHESGVIFGQFSVEGTRVVTTSSDNTARVWDLTTGTLLCQPLRHIERVLHAQFDREGRKVVTASFDGVAQVWALRRRFDPGNPIQHDLNVAPLAFSSNGAALLTAAGDKTARLWNVRTGQPLCEPIRPGAFVLSGDIAPEGRRVAIGCADGTAQMWDCGDWKASSGILVEPRMIGRPMIHSNSIQCVRFSNDGSRIVTASADGTARVWDATGQVITPLLVHGGKVLSAQFSHDARLLVTASEDYTARVWDAFTGHPVTHPLAHYDHVRWAEFSPDDERVVTASTDNTACVWNVRTSQRVVPPLHHPRIVNRAVFSPDGGRLATASIDRTARIWDARTGQALTPPLSHDSFVERVFFTADGQRLVTSSRSGLARVWDCGTGRPLTEWLNAGSFWEACFDRTTETIAVGALEGTVRTWKQTRAPTPVPARFLELAEAVAGIRLGDRGNLELLTRRELDEIGKWYPEENSSDFYGSLARWFVASTAAHERFGSDSR